LCVKHAQVLEYIKEKPFKYKVRLPIEGVICVSLGRGRELYKHRTQEREALPFHPRKGSLTLPESLLKLCKIP
jgi:hypothetical protein